MEDEDSETTRTSRQSQSSQQQQVARGHRIVIGVLILLLVDIIWVASSELTEFIFKSQHYSKPFFSTYLKTSLFMLYLPGFLVYRPWREQCQGLQWRPQGGRRGSSGYRVIQDSDDAVTDDTDNASHSDNVDSELETETVHSRGVARSLSAPSFQPIHSNQETGTDSEADTGEMGLHQY